MHGPMDYPAGCCAHPSKKALPVFFAHQNAQFSLKRPDEFIGAHLVWPYAQQARPPRKAWRRVWVYATHNIVRVFNLVFKFWFMEYYFEKCLDVRCR